MREIFRHRSKDVTNEALLAFIDYALIDKVALKLGNQVLLLKITSEDTSSWESWCYRCVLSYLAYKQYISLPCCERFVEDFVEEWA